MGSPEWVEAEDMGSNERSPGGWEAEGRAVGIKIIAIKPEPRPGD